MNIFEVGPRDGLQNEKHLLSAQDKLWLIESLVQAGLKDLETGAFVRADRIPQMADSETIHETLEQLVHPGVRYWYLVPNQKGLERALAKKVTHIALFSAVSDSFNKNNIGMTVDESFAEMQKVVTLARANGLKIRGYISTVWGCPFEGRIDPKKARTVIDRMLAMGVDQVSVGDTIGVAAPKAVIEILKPLKHALGSDFGKKIAVHFHDTRGTALANALTALELEVETFDSSIGGLGGCPFAPGAAGNLATEDLAYLFKEQGLDVGVDYQKLCETSLELAKRMGKHLFSSKALQAFVANQKKNSPWES